MEVKQSFHYDPLPPDGASFRLLRVLPSLSSRAPIQCELLTASIDHSAKSYVAGSYIWGDAEHSSDIIVNGAKVEVRTNLAGFLRGCRGKVTPLTIWIDAICIDQSNLTERSSQVRLMGQIYSKATATYSWLGSNPKMADALSTIEKSRIQGIDTGENSPSLKMGPIEWKPAAALKSACATFVACEYWSRSWIVQEFVLASRIYLLAGRVCIADPYDSFLKQIMADLEPDSKEAARKLALIRELHTMQQGYRRGVEFDLEDVFQRFSGTECTLPRDRLFSLVGLLTPDITTMLESSISYTVPAWQILGNILESGLLLNHARFTDLFSKKIIQQEHDPARGIQIQLPFRSFLHLPEHFASTCPNHRLGPRSDIIVSCWWFDYLARPYEVLILSSHETPSIRSHGRTLYTCGLLAPCSTECMKACSGHAIVGVALLWEATHYIRDARSSQKLSKLGWAYAVDSGPPDVEKHPDIHPNKLETKTLSENLQLFRDSVVVTREDAQRYRLATDLQTFIRLSSIVTGLDRTFQAVPNCAFQI
ncbi:hypothetical protein OPT61_g3738 [Boeremia exigua]|uniref:Uncharacterized protein n=1 Tax=Boeremia exigua TaxID=749465 RepID=A0ACC2IGP1_9PLEO|nr:hypothetical protein OPT61_g3738 [Boeremia exigua]